MKFEEWRTKTMTALIQLRKKYSENQKLVRDIDVLLTKLYYLHPNHLSSMIFYMYVVGRDNNVPEVLDLIPNSTLE
ncbi:MAG: hypothetical protein N3E48_03055 [Candidatus Bathyarchaeota archaeon]|nr:hypothetical protein [Candidatus Bathyarchaeota archaeon]